MAEEGAGAGGWSGEYSRGGLMNESGEFAWR